MNIQKFNCNLKAPSFAGHKRTIDKSGYEEHKFFYLYDKNKYNCEVELYTINKDDKGNFSIGEKVTSKSLQDGPVTIDPSFEDNLQYDIGYAYRFKLTEKDKDNNEIPDKVSYAFDNGTVIGIFDNMDSTDNKYNVVLKNRAIINKNGAMQLIMPDGYNPKTKVTVADALRAQALSGLTEEEALNEATKSATLVRTHANKLGGKFEGIIERLPELKNEGVARIVGTPYTKDRISSHKYWTENAFRVAPDFGSEEDFKKMQVELFKNGINWISDAALVNEGLGGIHMSELLRKGADSESQNMFRASEKIGLGILPNKTEFARVKFVNAREVLNYTKDGLEKNPNYDPTKPTYIQFYDERLASEEQKTSNEVITTYAYNNTGNILDITKHDDAVYPYSVEVDPHLLTRNLNKALEDSDKLDLENLQTIKNISDFENFKVVTKSEAGGLEVWDGNVDIAKLNFYACDNDEYRFEGKQNAQQKFADFERGSLAVRDYAITSGQYWTKLTVDSQLKYLSEKLAESKASTPQEYMSVIEKAQKDGFVPESTTAVVDTEVLENVLSGNYNLRVLDGADFEAWDYKDYITKHSMDLPLETIPVATNLLGILTSPYIAKKANVDSELGVSRFELSQEGNKNLPEKFSTVYAKMDEIYTDKITPMIENIMSEVSGLSDDGDEVTPIGRYILTEATPELTKYIILKALDKTADVKINTKTGEIDFSNVKEDKITMQSLGIPFSGKSLEEEASIVVNLLKKGIESISNEEIDTLKEAMTNRFKNRTENDFKVAEMIIDRTESGLGWRIDAAKDIASIDSVRANGDSVDETWDNVVDFWKRYNQSVLEINPHAYTTAEITDLAGLFDCENDGPDTEVSTEQADDTNAPDTEEGLVSTEQADDTNAPDTKEGLVSTEQADDTKAPDTMKRETREELQARRKYKSAGDAERKFLEETGITSLANYNYFFSLMPDLFALNAFENGNGSWMSQKEMNHELRNKLDEGWQPEIQNNPGFLFNSPADGVENSYTFFGNHDKPRPMHCLGLDMGLFNSNFAEDQKSSYKKNKTHRQIAADVLQTPQKDINFDKVSPKAIAMGQRMKDVLSKNIKDKELKEEIAKSIATLANGSHKGHSIDANAFGTRPFDMAIKIVLDETENRTGSKIPNREEIEAKALKEILVPAYDRYKSMYKLLMTLPGSPTDFAGDRVGTSGYETKAKNYHQQNRNVIHWEWLEDDKYSFIKDAYTQLNNIANLRKKPELSALNDGATISSPVNVPHYNQEQDKIEMVDIKVQSMIRYNEQGSVIISFHDLTGASTPLDKPMSRGEGRLISDENNKVYFNNIDNNARRGLKSGLEVGSKFINALDINPEIKEHTEYYEVGNDEKGYFIQKVKVDSNNKKEILPVKIESRDLNTLLLCKI